MNQPTDSHHRILVVDDQQSIHAAFVTVLSSKNNNSALNDIEASLFGDEAVGEVPATTFEIESAFQGEEAIEKLAAACDRGSPFGMAFVDMRMPPGWDGLQTIEGLWKLDPELQVVICTAYSDYSWSEVVERLGETDRLLLLKKPFANEEVYQLASALTEKRRLLKETETRLHSLMKTNEVLNEEIERRKKAEENLQHAANHDRLTELPNRTLLKKRIARCIDRYRCDGQQNAALLFLDVDNFKIINDSLGHDIGDQLLIQIAKRLENCSRPSDTISKNNENTTVRFGGDEFVILLEDLTHPSNAAQIAERILETLKHAYNISEHEVMVGTSIGIAVLDETIENSEQLVRNADMAMYRAKLLGKNQYAMFDQGMHNAVVIRLELERDLRRAIEADSFELAFQPIIDLRTEKVIGAESLIRWYDSDRGNVPPLDFIPIAEETGLILPIGRWVLRQSCEAVGRWNRVLPLDSQFVMSVNVSKRQITDPQFVTDLHSVLSDSNIEGNLLNLEITESLIMDNPELITSRLQEIKRLGVKIHMDDFGTGHSSLSCLHRFPIDVLKIDRSFISTMESNSDYAAIIQAIITLAHNLDAQVIAEGIETVEQLEKLKSLDCDFGQGYLFSRPIPELEFQQAFVSGISIPNILPDLVSPACSPVVPAI